jgi:hypothetical protein
MKLARMIASDIAGVALVIAGFEFSFLHWTIDGPGWLVSRFVSVDFNEGDGAFGFLLGIFLAWLWLSTAVWLAIYFVQRMLRAKAREGIALGLGDSRRFGNP